VGWGKTNLVTLVNKLVRSRNCRQAVHVIKLGRDLVAEQPPGTTRTNGPCFNVIRIAPHKITEGSLMRNLLSPGDDADLGTQSTVNTQHGAVDNGGQDEKVKHLTASLPHGSIAVLLLAFLVEAIYLGDLAGFMVAADENYPVGISGGGQVSSSIGREGDVIRTWLLDT
jgi:hypothetical protein